MKIILFYKIKGILKTWPEIMEEKKIDSVETLKETLSIIFNVMKNPYEYEFRVDTDNGKSWYILRRSDDVKNGVYDVTFSSAWNSHDTPEKMTAKTIKKILIDEFTK